ncbi:hypothetical protein FQN60_008322 [Etheostoma spectabile]|uniref:PDZ domain-containing protein n=1 Tax=Etheostoma spectabile TaxID=54343 RepID=A0A5J5CS23_9PERO|nr:hypothetical protein FQN60_008322 [Etheostoma spectabile]
MIHNTLKSTQPSEHSPRRTHSAAQRKLWRYSGCRGASQVECHRRSVCVLAADLNAGEEGGRRGSGGGPADQAGLQQLDTLLQLNGQPVEQWKCVDLAHAIRNSANEIILVVWRTGPSAKPNFEGLIHRPSYKPSTSNYDAPSPPTRRRAPDVGTSKTPPAVPPLPAHHRASATRRLLVNGSEPGNSSGIGAGTLGWGAQGGSAEELDGKPRHLHHPHTATLKGTRVKASNGDNYIILAPINPGSQILRPVYQDNHGTLGYIPHGRLLVHSSRGVVGVLFLEVLLVEVVVVEEVPLDLCSRALILSEEMILHESKHHSLKVSGISVSKMLTLNCLYLCLVCTHG